MIKAKASGGPGGPTYLIGLSHMNLDKLKEGKPISIDLTSMGGEGKVLIFAGATEQAMMEDLAKAGLMSKDLLTHPLTDKEN